MRSNWVKDFVGVYMRTVQFWGVFEGVQGIFL